MSDVAPARPLVDELRSVTIATADTDLAADVLTQVLELEPESSTLALPFAEASKERIDAVTYRPHGSDRGAIRVVSGKDRPPDTAMPAGWDCVEVVVRDVDEIARRLAERADGRLLLAPLTVDLSEHGSARHRSLVWRAPWGTHLVATSGLSDPIGRTFPATVGRATCGPVFEVHLRCPATVDATRPYRDALGMRELMAMDQTAGPIHEVWGVPTGTRIDMRMLTGRGAGTGHGALEIQRHAPEVLQSSPTGTTLPGGTALVTYRCLDLEAAGRALGANGIAVAPTCDGLWFVGDGGELTELTV